MRKVRVGIIGPGRVGERHASALSKGKNCVLWSVYSRDYERAATFALRYGAKSPTPAYDQLANMLSDSQLDAVIIALPDKLHAECIKQVLPYQKHILVEKPFVTDIEVGKQLINACENKNIKVGVGYHLRFKPILSKIATIIHNHDLGDILHMNIHWAYHFKDTNNWRNNRELSRFWSLSALGTHALDMILWYLGPVCGEIIEVKGMTSRAIYKSSNDESFQAILKFASGATAQFSGSIHYDHRLSLEIYGSKGHIKAYEITSDNSKHSFIWNGQPITVLDQNPYVGQIENFSQAILEDHQPAVTPKEGLANLQILLQFSGS